MISDRMSSSIASSRPWSGGAAWTNWVWSPSANDTSRKASSGSTTHVGGHLRDGHPDIALRARADGRSPPARPGAKT